MNGMIVGLNSIYRLPLFQAHSYIGKYFEECLSLSIRQAGIFKTTHRFTCCKSLAIGSDIRMVQRYAHLAPEHLSAYAGNISGLRGVTGKLSTTPEKKVLGARN
jgi:hypothetical protein